jgi:hypothetical protein
MGHLLHRPWCVRHRWRLVWAMEEPMKFTEKTRQVIRERAANRCELCGTPVGIDAQIHHRKPRGMGGTKDPRSRSAANGLFVHFRCHERIERNREESYAFGWLVLQTQDSHETPVRLHHGWFLLNDDGSLDYLASVLDERYQLRSQPSDEPEDSTPLSVLSTSE